MTNRIALFLALAIITVVLADVIFNGSAALLFVARKMLTLIEYLAIWR